MPNYNYECINRQGETQKGQISADNYDSAVEKLKKMGLAIIDLNEVGIAMPKKSTKTFGKKKKVSLGELSMFSNQLAALIGAGIPVTRALYTLGEQATNSTLKDAVLTIAHNIEGGMSLTDAFGMYPKIFSDLYISMIHSGEVGGMLEEVLKRLAEQLQKDKTLQDSIKSATFYPRMVGAFALLMFGGMLIVLVPIFKGFIPENVEPPMLTKIVFGLSDLLRNYWYIVLLVIVGIVLSVNAYIKSPSGKRAWDKMRFKIPAFGPITHKSVLARFCRTFSTLLEGGIPVIQALESAAPTSGSITLTEAIKNTIEKIEEGKTIAGPLMENKLFPPMMIQMISVGEESGTLSKLLDKVAGFYEEEVNALSKNLSTIIEPIMLVGVGLIVGLMLIALYLPMFTSVTQAGGGF